MLLGKIAELTMNFFIIQHFRYISRLGVFNKVYGALKETGIIQALRLPP